MTLLSRSLASLVCLLSLAPASALAQQASVEGPPPIMVINREFLKPGRGGSAHEKTEAAYLAAARAGKAPFNYFALTSMTGPDQALFVSNYASFAEWEAQNKLADKTPALGMSLDHAMLADGDLLSSTDTTVWMHRPDLSLNESSLAGVRYMEIQQVHIKPGHRKELEDGAKMYNAGYKNIPGANWAAYQQVYGNDSNIFLFITLYKSLSETDAAMGPSFKSFMAAVGEGGMKKLDAMEQDVAQSESLNLFRISPKMSLVPDAIIKQDPDFWKPKPAAPKPAAKPAP